MTFPVVLVVCLLTPVVVGSMPRDCHEVHTLNNNAPSGVYNIYPSGSTAVQAYCDMDTDGGRWTVFQRRMDGSETFIRLWEDYKRGFGNADGEYWLGLENIYHLTYKRSELRVDMEDFTGDSASRQYTNFYIDSEDNGYRLHFEGGSSHYGDSLNSHNGARFSTLDRDQDGGGTHCAKTYFGGWWYHQGCIETSPNGVYLWGDYSTSPGGGGGHPKGVIWNQWKGVWYSLKSFSMKVRPEPRREEQDGQTDQ